jgi:hypothetical protein
MSNDDTLLWIATVLPLGILIGLAAVQAMTALVEHRRHLWLDAEEGALPDQRGQSTRRRRRRSQGPGRDEAAQRP